MATPKEKSMATKSIFKSVFYLRSNYVNKEGKATVMLRIYLNGERISIGSTGIMVNPKGWSKAKNQMAGRSTEALSTNLRLSNIQQRVYKIFEKLEGTNELSLARIKSEYNGNQKEIKTVAQLFEKYSSDIKRQEGKEICHATYLRYERCMRRFIDMVEHTYKRRDLYIAEVNPMVIHNFQVYLTANAPLAHNAVVKMMKTLKTIFIFAQRMGIMDADPFQDMHFRTTPTDRGFLTDEEVMALLAKDVPVKRLELVRDLFVFSCFTGLAYVDLANFRPSDITTINDRKWIKSQRAKTSVPINVMLLDIPLQLIEKYQNDPRRNGMIFPMISNQRMNSYLKEIGDICGINKNLTFHLSRHTFATMTLSKGVPIESVSKMLGHTNIKTTQIYARITDKKIEHDMNELADKLIAFSDTANSAMLRTKAKK